MTRMDGDTGPSPLGSLRPRHRIALTAGRAGVPPSYFLVDLASALRASADTRLFAQRTELTPSSAEALGRPATTRSPLGMVSDIKGFSPDLIHHHWATWSSPAVFASKQLGVPLVVSMHGYDAFLPKSTGLRGPAYDVIKRVERRMSLRSASAIVVNSEFMRKRVISIGGDPSRIRLIRHSVDTKAFSVGRTPRQGVLFVGRLSIEKGCELLIRALSALSPSEYEMLSIVGTGAEEGRLRKISSELGVSCRFVGQLTRSDVAAEMQRARLVVVPSLPARGQTEASGMAPLEALACGTPVVVTRVGGLPENLPNAFSDLICEPDENSLSQAISRGLAVDGQNSAETARHHVEVHHSLNRLGVDFIQLYSGLIR